MTLFFPRVKNLVRLKNVKVLRAECELDLAANIREYLVRARDIRYKCRTYA